MKVWIDQNLCTGDAQCVEICPDVFFEHDDGVSYRCYVRNPGQSGYDSHGAPQLQNAGGPADVPRSLEAAVLEAAEYCPGECIFVEP